MKLVMAISLALGLMQVACDSMDKRQQQTQTLRGRVTILERHAMHFELEGKVSDYDIARFEVDFPSALRGRTIRIAIPNPSSQNYAESINVQPRWKDRWMPLYSTQRLELTAVKKELSEYIQAEDVDPESPLNVFYGYAIVESMTINSVDHSPVAK